MTFAATAAVAATITCLATTLAQYDLTPAAMISGYMMVPDDAFTFAEILTLRGAIEEGRYGPIFTIAHDTPHIDALIRKAHRTAGL